MSTYGAPSGSTCLNTNGATCTTAANVPASTATLTLTGSVPTGYTASGIAPDFKAGDDVLLVDVSQQNGQQFFSTAKLSAVGAVSCSNVQLTFYETQTGGFNYSNTIANDRRDDRALLLCQHH